MPKITRIYIHIILIFISSSIIAQKVTTTTEVDTLETNVSIAEISFDNVLPIGSFKTNLDKSNLYGFSLAYLNQRKAENYSFWGIGFSLAHMGSLSNTISTIGNVPFSDRTGSNFMSLYGIYRQYAPFYNKIFEPFFEANIGPSVFYTITTTTFLDDESTDTNFDETYFGLAYSVGVGFTANIYQGFIASFKCNFVGGTNVTYAVPGELVQEFPIDNFAVRNSQTNNLRFHFGLGYSF